MKSPQETNKQTKKSPNSRLGLWGGAGRVLERTTCVFILCMHTYMCTNTFTHRDRDRHWGLSQCQRGWVTCPRPQREWQNCYSTLLPPGPAAFQVRVSWWHRLWPWTLSKSSWGDRRCWKENKWAHRTKRETEATSWYHRIPDEIFFFSSTGTWTQGLQLEPLCQPFFMMGIFKIGSRELFPGAGFQSQTWSLPPE
jgi:hypothetical protein